MFDKLFTKPVVHIQPVEEGSAHELYAAASEPAEGIQADADADVGHDNAVPETGTAVTNADRDEDSTFTVEPDKASPDPLSLDTPAPNAVEITPRLLAITGLANAHTEEALRALLSLPDGDFHRHVRALYEEKFAAKQVLTELRIAQQQARTAHG